MRQIKKINELRGEITEMGRSNTTMIQSLGNTLSFLKNLEQEFGGLRADTNKLKATNRELNQEFETFTTNHKRKIAGAA